jgi:oxygen-dependent protoporphyrinogen oxidase
VSHVVIVGGGIAGLAAAFELSGGAGGPGPLTPAVTVLDAGEFGGMLRCERLGDQLVDVGPDGFLARRPEALALVRELGAADRLAPIGAQGAWVFARGRLRPLPQGLALGVPTRLRDLRTRTALGVLGPLGAARASLDLFAPRPARRSALEDRTIGSLVGDKLGRRVVDTLIDPLIGGIHAGRVRDLSAAAIFPPLLAAGQGRGSMMRALRGATTNGGDVGAPAFFTLREGLGTLADLLVGTLSARGVALLPNTAAVRLERGTNPTARWLVETSGTMGEISADAVVLATPAHTTARLLEPHNATAAGVLSRIDAAAVATVTLRCTADELALPDTGTGVLVPSPTHLHEETLLVTAITFLDRKWPHLARDGATLLRASVGRIDDVRFEDLDDAALVARVADEVGSVLSTDVAPSASLVTRWPSAFPQYRVNHLSRVDGLEAAARNLGGIALAGATYRGVGVPACIASGRTAARTIRGWLATQS